MGIVLVLFLLAAVVAGMALFIEGFQLLLILSAVLVVAALVAAGTGRVRLRA